MTAEEYWNSEGVRFVNEDGTLPTVEERVKEAYSVGWQNSFERAHQDRVSRDQEENL